MSDGTPSKKAGGVWTENEKYQFLLKIIGQVGGGSGGLAGVHPRFEDIDLNDRTAKALGLMWIKIKKEAVEASGGNPLATPSKRKANRDAPETPATKKRRTPAKSSAAKGSAAKASARKRAKNFESEDDSEPVMPELGDTSEEGVLSVSDWQSDDSFKPKVKEAKPKVKEAEDEDEGEDEDEA